MSNNIPKGWKRVKLGELVNIGSSKRIFYKEYVDKGIPFYRSKEIIEKYNRCEISTTLFISEKKYNEIKAKFGVPEEGNILLTSVGTLGIPYIVKKGEKFYFKDGNLTWFREFSENLLNTFLYYWLISPMGKQELENSAIGSTQPALTIKALKNLEILLPPLPEQKAIASVLSSLDDKIDLLHRQNQTLEQMAQTLFRKWFIEDAKEDWEEVKLGEVIDIISGYNHKKHELVEKGAILLSMGSIIKEYGFNIKASRQIKIDDIDKKYFCTHGDIFITTRDVTQNAELLGSPGIIPSYFNRIPIILGSNLYKIIIKDKIVNNTFLYELLKSKVYREYVKANASGTSVLMFRKHDLMNFKFKKPEENYFKKHIESLSDLHKKLDNNYTQILTLEKLRDTLLPKLMSGELRVKESMKKYYNYMDEISDNELLEGLIGYGMFCDKLPPIFTSENFFYFLKNNYFDLGNNMCFNTKDGKDYVRYENIRNIHIYFFICFIK
jgi:type I restriction enzyme S subunit